MNDTKQHIGGLAGLLGKCPEGFSRLKAQCETLHCLYKCGVGAVSVVLSVQHRGGQPLPQALAVHLLLQPLKSATMCQANDTKRRRGQSPPEAHTVCSKSRREVAAIQCDTCL